MLTKADLINALKPILKKLDDLETGQKRIEKKLDEQIADTADHFHQTWNTLDELKKTVNEKIHKIETHIGLPHS